VGTEELLLKEFIRDPQEFMIEYIGEIPRSQVPAATERVIPGYTERRDNLRRKIVEALSGRA